MEATPKMNNENRQFRRPGMALYVAGLILLIGWDFAFLFWGARVFYELEMAAVLFLTVVLVTAGVGNAPMRKVKAMIGIIALSVAIEMTLGLAAWSPDMPMWAVVALSAWVFACSVAGLAYTLWSGRAGRAFFLLWGLQLVLMVSILDIAGMKWSSLGHVTTGLMARSICILAAGLLIGRAIRLGMFSQRNRRCGPGSNVLQGPTADI